MKPDEKTLQESSLLKGVMHNYQQSVVAQAYSITLFTKSGKKSEESPVKLEPKKQSGRKKGSLFIVKKHN